MSWSRLILALAVLATAILAAINAPGWILALAGGVVAYLIVRDRRGDRIGRVILDG